MRSPDARMHALLRNTLSFVHKLASRLGSPTSGTPSRWFRETTNPDTGAKDSWLARVPDLFKSSLGTESMIPRPNVPKGSSISIFDQQAVNQDRSQRILQKNLWLDSTYRCLVISSLVDVLLALPASKL
jgi:hypothetical protein